MRWHIIRVLLHKEALRNLANRGGIALALLLVVAALLLSVFGGGAESGGFVRGVRHCVVDYWEDGPWVEHLRRNVPDELGGQVRFRPVERAPVADGVIVYPTATAAIQLRTSDGPGPRYRVWFWHPGDGGGLAPFEAWFWKETHRYYRERTADLIDELGPDARSSLDLPAAEYRRTRLKGGLDSRSGLATSLVMFGLFFVCVYLLPSLTCEERERGVLLAQALSPASPSEILAARLLFYPLLGVGLSALLAGIYSPAVLARPFFWMALAASSFGSFGIGLTIASLARTQRAASMGALCYMMAVTLLLVICQSNNIPGVSWLALEYHCPRALHAALADAVNWYPWGNLAGASVLAVVWASAAAVLFPRYGWQ